MGAAVASTRVAMEQLSMTFLSSAKFKLRCPSISAQVPTRSGFSPAEVHMPVQLALCKRCFWRAPKRRWRRPLGFLIFAATACVSLLALYIALQDVPGTVKALDELYNPPRSEMRPYAQQNSTARILLVSAFFPLPQSKHAPEEYTSWLTNFLGVISTPIYFYTTPALSALMSDTRRGLPLHINTTFSSAFSVPPLIGLEDKYSEMHAKDREKNIHNPGLYAVWNAKPWLLNAAVNEARGRGEEYDYAFWVDAGSFRSGHAYAAWPDAERVRSVLEDHVEPHAPPQIFIPLALPPPLSAGSWKPEDGPFDADLTEGSFFGGRPEALAHFAVSFYAFHDAHLAMGIFVGKDQTLFNALLLTHPERFKTVLYRDPFAPARLVSPLVYWGGGGSGVGGFVGTVLARLGMPGLDAGYLGACGGEWWYYQFFLASRDERDAMRQIWLRNAVDRSKWLGRWVWWKERQTCRLTRVIAGPEKIPQNGWHLHKQLR